MSIALLTRARHVSITWAKCMQRISHPNYLMRVLISILSLYLCICVASAIFLLGFLTKILCTYSLFVYFSVTALLTNLQLITICRIISSSSRPVFLIWNHANFVSEAGVPSLVACCSKNSAVTGAARACIQLNQCGEASRRKLSRKRNKRMVLNYGSRRKSNV
jgi:hypothetical protein